MAYPSREVLQPRSSPKPITGTKAAPVPLPGKMKRWICQRQMGGKSVGEHQEEGGGGGGGVGGERGGRGQDRKEAVTSVISRTYASSN